MQMEEEEEEAAEEAAEEDGGSVLDAAVGASSSNHAHRSKPSLGADTVEIEVYQGKRGQLASLRDVAATAGNDVEAGGGSSLLASSSSSSSFPSTSSSMHGLQGKPVTGGGKSVLAEVALAPAAGDLRAAAVAGEEQLLLS